MPLEIQCPHCRRKFRVPEKYAGKRVKCPKCEETFAVPAAKQPAPDEPVGREEAAPEQAEPDRPAAQRWYLQTEEGQHFGPASREELDDWLAEGRIDALCQVLCEGWEQWKWADEVFPELAEASTETQPAGVAAEENPFAGIGEAVRPSQEEVNPYVSPGEVSGGIDVVVESGEGGAVTPRVRIALAQTRPWVLFLSILGFIGGGLMIFVGLIIIAAGAAIDGPNFGFIQAIICLLGSPFYLAPSYFLFRYGQQIGRFLRSSGPRELETALTAQKSFWKLIGILTILFMALYAAMIVIMVLVGITAG